MRFEGEEERFVVQGSPHPLMLESHGVAADADGVNGAQVPLQLTCTNEALSGLIESGAKLN